MKRDRRFPIVLSGCERSLLQRLAERERIPAAAVVRRLIWREGERLKIAAREHTSEQEAPNA